MQRIQPLITILLVIVAVIIELVGAQSIYLVGDDVPLTCTSDSTSSLLQFIWDDEFPDPENSIRIATVARDETDKSDLPKYGNFRVDTTGFPASTQLVIENIQLDDQLGPYGCRPTAGTIGAQRYEIQLEDAPISVSINCIPDAACPANTLDPAPSSMFTCTCTAIGAYPDSLTLTWTGADESTQASSSDSTSRAGYYDITGESTFTPTAGSNTVTCVVRGYTNIIPENDRTATYTFEPPVCSIAVDRTSSDCTTVDLSCECSDVKPELGQYLFYDGSNYVAQASNQWTSEITSNEPYSFSCRGCNGVNYGTDSGNTDVSDTCPLVMPTLTAEPTSTDAKNEVPYPELSADSQGKDAALVIGWVLVAVLAGLLFGMAIYRWRNGNSQPKRGFQGSDSENHAEAGINSPAYMDLKQSGGHEEPDQLKEIPEKNVAISSIFPGQGIIEYRKVKIARNAKNGDAVMKTLSDNAPIALLKLFHAEIKSVIILPEHMNVIGNIGWCDAVPRYLLSELVDGVNLSQHLSENFSPQKTHQYGNLKRKKFQIEERGDPSTLPKYALDVARGMRFLLNNNFIHPGLRASKILVDSAGRCTLYDFLSIERSDELTSLLWDESVPYQWMSPEYLLLGTISSAGDVWSFGVLLWEIFSYGSKPYSGRDRNAVETSLRKMDRLSMPQNCPGAIWNLMILCWEQKPEQRPGHDAISSKMSTMCSDDKEYAEISSSKT